MYLLIKNLRTKRKLKKLDYIKVGPFLIAERKGLTNYRLVLLKDTKIYPVFYVSLLELADLGTTVQTTLYFQPEELEYKVEKIVRK